MPRLIVISVLTSLGYLHWHKKPSAEPPVGIDIAQPSSIGSPTGSSPVNVEISANSTAGKIGKPSQQTNPLTPTQAGPTKLNASSNYERGTLYVNRGQLQLAIGSLNEAIKLDPKVSVFYEEKAKAEFKLGIK